MKKDFFKKILDKKNKEVVLICELSGNHNNSLNHLTKLVNRAIDQRVDLIKFQVYKPETLTLNTKSKHFKITHKNKWSKYKNLYSLFEKVIPHGTG